MATARVKLARPNRTPASPLRAAWSHSPAGPRLVVRWRGDVWRRCQAVVFSAVVHAAALVLMACWIMGPLGQGGRTELVAALPSPDDQPPLILETQVPLSSELDLSPAGSSVTTNDLDAPALPALSAAIPNTSAQSSGTLFGSRVDDPRLLSSGQVADGAPPPAVSKGSYSGLMGSLGDEIGGMLGQSHVTLIWCFDESLSMKDDQYAIAGEISALYGRLSAESARHGRRCQSLVSSYGEHFHRHLRRPTADVAAVEWAMRELPVDTTGHEYMCQALLHCLAQYRETSSRSDDSRPAIVLVTDETGDQAGNMRLLEQVVREAREARARIFVLGREALFGVERGWMRWDGKILPIDRGPETAFMTRLARDAFGHPRAAVGSGFGPYEQCRLTWTTQGRFFLLEGSESSLVGERKITYDADRMRAFRPELDAREKLEAAAADNPLRQILMRLARSCDAWSADSERGQLLREWVGDAATLRSVLRQQETIATRFAANWRQAAQDLADVRSWREQERHPRWQADYDLMEAQVAGYAVLAAQHAHLLHGLRAELAEPRSQGAWHIVVSPAKLPVHESFAEEVRLAEKRLSVVAQRYAGTPWGVCAEDDLSPGLGLTWQSLGR